MVARNLSSSQYLRDLLGADNLLGAQHVGDGLRADDLLRAQHMRHRLRADDVIVRLGHQVGAPHSSARHGT